MRGVLIINTGSPKSCDKSDVKQFIGDMLSDPLVMSTVPNWFRPILARNIIAPLRGSKSAARYVQIWDKENNQSPLINYSKLLAEKIEKKSEIPVEAVMRYGEPSILSGFQRLIEKCPNLHEVLLVPMFPQYAQSSYQTAVDAVKQCFAENGFTFNLKVAKPFYNHNAYIKALAKSLKPYVTEKYDRLVFNFHSLPLVHVEEAHVRGRDFDYVYQIKETVHLLSEELGLDANKNRIVYSSAIGKKWLEPDVNDVMRDLGKNGVKRVIALTPGFPADNLESFFDIDIEAHQMFIENGGEQFTFVPGLNAQDCWVEGMIKIITNTN